MQSETGAVERATPLLSDRYGHVETDLGMAIYDSEKASGAWIQSDCHLPLSGGEFNAR